MLLQMDLILFCFYLFCILCIRPFSHPFSFDHIVFLRASIHCICLHSSKSSSFICDPAQSASFCWLVVKFSGRDFPRDFSFLLEGKHRSLVSKGFPLGRRATLYYGAVGIWMLSCIYLFFPFKYSFIVAFLCCFIYLEWGIFYVRFHRIVEWLELGDTLKIIWFQRPCHGSGYSPREQIAQKPIPGIRHPQLLSFVWFGFEHWTLLSSFEW